MPFWWCWYWWWLQGTVTRLLSSREKAEAAEAGCAQTVRDWTWCCVCFM